VKAARPIWSPFFKNLTRESLTEARQLGLLVSAWTPTLLKTEEADRNEVGCDHYQPADDC